MNSLERLASPTPASVVPPPSPLRGRRYGEDRLYLLVRDPRVALALWELTPALHARAEALARERGVPIRYQLAIERRQEARGPVVRVATFELRDALGGERDYLNLPRPGGECRAVLGISLAGTFEPLFSSSWVPVPPEGPCAEEGAWDLTEEGRAWLLGRDRSARAFAGATSSAARYLDPEPREIPPR